MYRAVIQRIDKFKIECEEQKRLLDIGVPCFNILFDINSKKPERKKAIAQLLDIRNYGFCLNLKTI